MAQRLVRTVCSECKEPYEPDADKLPADLGYQKGEIFYRGRGCRKCHNTGYYGRAGLFELMVTSDAIRESVMARRPASDIVNIARREGLRLLREDGWIKVRQGVTTPEEVMRCTKM